jgi:hypothetical protein
MVAAGMSVAVAAVSEMVEADYIFLCVFRLPIAKDDI